jgi:TPR repeat protein
MPPMQIPRANAVVRFARMFIGRVARPLAFAVAAVALIGTQEARADCQLPSVPTVDSSSLTDASLRAEDSFALNRLGIMYARGRGVQKNSKLAIELFRQLAMDGYPPAMVNLGTLYERGMAGRRDHRQAYAWIRAALALGVPKEDYDATLFKLGMIAARLGLSRTPAAERLAFNIIARIGERCEHSSNPYESASVPEAHPICGSAGAQIGSCHQACVEYVI